MGLTALLAQEPGGAFELSTTAGATMLAIALVAAAFMFWLGTSTRPSRVRAAAPTMDLRPETPAVVDLLTGGFDVEDDAMPATVVDLAARGWYTIDDIGGDRIVLRLRERATDDRLTPYEERVLRHIRAHATDGVVPAPVLTLGPEGVSRRWFTGFRREVTAHANELGLCHRRWDLRHLVMAWGAVVVAAAAPSVFAYTADRTADPYGWGSVGNLLLGVTFVVVTVLAWYAQRISRSDAQVDTPAGLAAARHWMGVRDFYRDNGRFEDKPAPSVVVWERNLAYATALGLAPLVQRQIPFETEHDRNAWSLATGHWRRVKVSYGARRPGWGLAPWTVAISSLLRAALAGALAYLGYYVASTEIDVDAFTLSDDHRRYLGLGGLVLAAIMSVVAAVALWRLALGVSDLFARRTVEGELVRRRELPTGHRLPKPVQWWLATRSSSRHGHRSSDDQRKRRWFLAIDTGDTERIRALRVRPQIYRQVRQGARVRATVTPRLGYVTAIESVAPPRPSAADEPGTAHPLISSTIGRAGGLSATLAQMEQLTGPDGTPLLDVTDDEGVALRERLAQGRDQLERLDPGEREPGAPRTPLIGHILDTLTGDGRPDHPDAGARADRDPDAERERDT